MCTGTLLYKQPYMKLKIFCIIALAITTLGCKKTDSDTTFTGDKLVFGSFYGMCGSNCTKMYEVSSTSLLRFDSARYYPTLTYGGTVTLDTTRMRIAQTLLAAIPTELTLDTNKTFGCPDCRDQGGIYLEVYKSGVKHKYVIDPDNTSDQSAAVISFKNKVDTVLQSIN